MSFKPYACLAICTILVLQGCMPVGEQFNQLAETVIGQAGYSSETLAGIQAGKPISGFGMGSSTNWRVENLDAAYAEMHAMGVKYVREEFPMEYIQQGSGQYDFNAGWGSDRMIASAARQNLKIVGLLAYGPSASYADDSAFLALWEEYVRAVVERYSKAIDHWEIGNEMNSLRFWRKVRRSAEQVEPRIYAAMLESAYRIIKAADKNDTVIMGGLINDADFSGGFSPLTFVEEVGKITGNQYFDAIGLHVYWGESMPESERNQIVTTDARSFSMADYVETFAADVARLKGREVPIWITETGYDLRWLEAMSRQYNTPAEDLQALALARVYTALLSIPQVEAVFWYTYAEPSNSAEDFQLRLISKKAYRTLAEALTGSKPLGRFEVVDKNGNTVAEAYDYRFLKPSGETVMVYWKNSADSDFISAKVVNLAKSPARQFNLESGIKTAGMLVDEETTEIGIMEKPFFMAGWMNEATRLVSEPGQPSGNTSIVYIKEGNVWLYDTKTGQPRQITSDGKPNSMEGVAKQYLKALVSPNGAYVAFDSSYGYFFIYNLETGQATPIAKVSSPDIAGDALLGWDDNNRLYYTRTNGECVVTAELKGPDSVDVLRFEPESGNSERISTLPKVWDAPHAYSIGISISPKGRYVKAYNGACSVGLKTTFLWDMHKETYFFDSYKDVVVSNDESMTAYIDDSEVVYEDYEIESGSTKIYRSNPDMQEQVLLYSPAKERRINYGLSWSPDDQLLAFMEYPGGKGADYSIIKIITSEGAEVQTLPGQNILFGSWSPDGKSIVYTQIDPSGDFRAPGRMVIFNLNSQTATEIDMIDRWSTPDW